MVGRDEWRRWFRKVGMHGGMVCLMRYRSGLVLELASERERSEGGREEVVCMGWVGLWVSIMPLRRDLGESSSSNLVERDQEQVEEDILLRDLVPLREGQARETFVPPPAPPPPPPPQKNKLDDTLYHIAKFVKLMPTLFKGDPDPLVADSFMDRVEKHINAINLAMDQLKITLATYNFVGDAEIWWKTVSHTHNLDTMIYATFKKLYYEKYFPVPKRRELKKDFDGLKQGSMIVTEYENKFTLLLRFSPGIANDEEGKIEKFVDGLNLTIMPIIAASEPTEYAKAVRKALVVEAESRDSKAIRESYKHNRGISAFPEGQSSKKQKHEQSGCGQLGHYKSQCTQTQVAQMICFKYGQLGYHKSQCTQIQVASGGCFECGQQGHMVKDCPQQTSGLGRGGVSQQRQIASYSFISSSFAWALGLEVSQLDRLLYVDTSIGDSVILGRVCKSYSIIIAERVLKFYLILLEMTRFDVILRMDWLSSFRAVIDCFRSKVSVYTPDRDCFYFVGDRCDPLTHSFYGVRGRDR
ncbi:uncharacterized protein LOC132309454 [Cornus florida]|uniref:uncharacterized protein LOC132309454 n=1 Tax=Cornus florida TaxID=4283 RepID=UPI00289C6396|nr:uncharacterized protein LOC132309454 [Cornus florida]